MNYLLVALCAFGGGILSALLGWADSIEPFDARKFAKSVGFALLAGLGFAVSYAYQDTIGVKDYFLAILGGAGWDVLTNRVKGTLDRL